MFCQQCAFSDVLYMHFYLRMICYILCIYILMQIHFVYEIPIIKIKKNTLKDAQNREKYISRIIITYLVSK